MQEVLLVGHGRSFCVKLLCICSSVYITCLVLVKDVRLSAHIQTVDRHACINHGVSRTGCLKCVHQVLYMGYGRSICMLCEIVEYLFFYLY